MKVKYYKFPVFGEVWGSGRLRRFHEVYYNMGLLGVSIRVGQAWKNALVLCNASDDVVMRVLKRNGITTVRGRQVDLSSLDYSATIVIFTDRHGSVSTHFFDRSPKACVDSIADLYYSLFANKRRDKNPVGKLCTSDLKCGYIPDCGFPVFSDENGSGSLTERIDSFFKTWKLYYDRGYYLSNVYDGKYNINYGDQGILTPLEVKDLSTVPADAKLKGFIKEGYTLDRCDAVNLIDYVVESCR